jgi:toxin ParE1/3/4
MANEMTVKWLRKPLANLDQEAAYIAQENPLAAQTIVIKITDAVELLKTNPGLGKSGRITGTRELVIADTHYLVPYRVNTKKRQIEILRVFHTSRKLPKGW